MIKNICEMERSKIFIKNTAWELGYYLLIIALGFFAPRFIILTYGSDVNGLSSTITQILNIILLLQSGATTAAVYSLYKPIADHNWENISEKVTAANLYFKKMSYVFLGIMFVVAGVTAWNINSGIPEITIFIAFIIMGFKSFLDLYFTSKYRIVFTAFQEKFIMSIATLLEQTIYYVLVFTTIFFKWNFLFLFFWLFFGCIVKIMLLKIVYLKRYPDIKRIGNLFKSATIHGKNYSLVNEVSHSIVTTSTAIMISFMYGLDEVSVFSIYVMVFSALNLFSTALNSSFGPTFANLCAKGETKRAKDVFTIFQFLYIMMNTILVMCAFYLIIPFMRLYIEGKTEVSYINITLAILYSISGLLSACRIPYNLIVSSYGFFKETWLQPVITAIISLLISYFFGRIQYAFILIGPIIFYLVNFVYQYFKLKRLTPHLISSKVFIIFAISLVGIVLVYFAMKGIEVPHGFWAWLLAAVFTLFAVTIYIFVASRIFLSKEFYLSMAYIRSLCKAYV